ncbi:hypothetical protein RF55_8544 [Lasius niger]|uniref:Axoneme-associated protein n=1 Tax=Lasius niger TaxID=67767 RepID=A0A0J7KMW9_LASNI|nr:hypothetical protein RF55_8544 [Lasius niger]
MKGRIKRVMEGGCEAKEKGRKRGWWNDECKEEKNKRKKRREENERWEKELSEIKTEGQVWEVVRRERRRKKRANEDIKMEEWDRQLSKEKGKMVAFFIDLRAAFDSVDRGVLIEVMRERGVREGLISRCEDVLRETRNRVREELQRDKLRGRAGKKAWGFEKRLEEGRGSEIARRSWDEMRVRCKKKKGVSSWEMERCGFFENRGLVPVGSKDFPNTVRIQENVIGE